jgi:GcrA cell cycle regulator
MQGYWTVERVNYLKKRNTDRVTPTIIAAELGTSRNAVIGKLRRMNIPLGTSMVTPTGLSLGGGIPRNHSETSRDLASAMTIRARIGKPLKEFRWPDEGRCNGLTLMDLDAKSCRWPLSGSGAHTRFCGEKTVWGKPYCQTHSARSCAGIVNLEEEFANA